MSGKKSSRMRKSKSMHRRRRIQKGGDGYPNGGSWATAVYGDSNSQHPQGGAGNVIAMNQPTTCNMTGGDPTTGGNMLDVVAVPAVLLAANQLYGKKKYSKKNFSKRRFRRFRGTRRNRK